MKILQMVSLVFVILFLTSSIYVYPQPKSNLEIKKLVDKYKIDPKGPYKAIRWFCRDGTTLPPDQRCSEPGGVQRAQYKDEVVDLQIKNHLFFGQILSTTPFDAFWDSLNLNSRLKQYILERYLAANDNGWILRKAKFYRGSVQAEDEENWGINFYKWLLSGDDHLSSNFFLVRYSAKFIPHKGDDNRAQSVRSLSKEIADLEPAFSDLRIKIHGRPDPSDLESVKKFLREKTISEKAAKLAQQLIKDLEYTYSPIDFNSLKILIKDLPDKSNIANQVNRFISDFGKRDVLKESDAEIINALADLMSIIRQDILNYVGWDQRLALLDLSLKLEDLLLIQTGIFRPGNIQELLRVNFSVCKAVSASGLIENWEWDRIRKYVEPSDSENIDLEKFIFHFENSRRALEWGTSMVAAHFEDIIEQYSGFEPLAVSFNDDIIRSSMLLPLGNIVSVIGDKVTQYSGIQNNVLGIRDQNDIRGLNPGIALGELVVVKDINSDFSENPNKIYLFLKPPSDLKPVGGIATVSEGNLVSHVQLLARNLGIPNAVISQRNLNSLESFSGKKIFYAVSPSGTVIMKLEKDMSEEEKNLFSKKERITESITIPTDRINLKKNKILNLKDLRAKDSGILCGPKAANLGELKFLFPQNVVDGLVIPFGIFKDHMDQIIPGKDITYWQFLNSSFEKAKVMESNNSSSENAEQFIFEKLAELRSLIKEMTLSQAFINELKQSFKSILGKEIGSIPIFIRSDTNMEDLKDFSGAGLNLTVFNAIDESQIVQGIKEVWASPYTERSYKWRQKLMNNPQNVYPSILIIPSVNVDKSGVIVTTGIASRNKADLTISFSRGAGGAVEGQIAESYLLKNFGENLLLSPSREHKYSSLPKTGGINKKMTTFELPILSDAELGMIRNFTSLIVNKIPKAEGIDSQGPFDIELGIKDKKIWLFQIRPFIENKKAVSSTYLMKINPEIPLKKKINILGKI